MYNFKVGASYSRRDVFRALDSTDPRGGSWYTGYTSYEGEWFIFCGVGTPGRTGHDYNNHFIGKDLVWFGKSRSKLAHPSIQALLSESASVYVFFREDDRSSFTFAGVARAKEVLDTSPVQVTWTLGCAYGPAGDPTSASL